MKKNKVSKAKILSLLKRIAEASFTITKWNNKIEVRFQTPFYKDHYTWRNNEVKWIAPDNNLIWESSRSNVLTLNNVTNNILTNEEKMLFERCGFQVMGNDVILFMSNLELSINIGTEESLKEIFIAAKNRAEKEASKITDPTKFHFKKKAIGTNYKVEAFIQKDGRPTLSTLILNENELSFVQEAIKLFKNKKATTTKIVDFFIKYKFEVCKNVRSSRDNGYGSYTYFNAQYKLILPGPAVDHTNQQVLDFKKIMPILTDAYRIYMQPRSGLYLDNETSTGWAIYSTQGGYTYVG
jgi:hypothetical protein